MKNTIFLFVFILILQPVFAQSENYTDAFLNFFKEDHTKKTETPSTWFQFYKKYISSQDHGNCIYEPSCSVYAKNAIKKYGFLKGMIISSDRLSRCNSHQTLLLKKSGNTKITDYP
jgi:putative component of membrane protein insertase Oxa1/YidC/SpoIIIJ protein YidD